MDGLITGYVVTLILVLCLYVWAYRIGAIRDQLFIIVNIEFWICASIVVAFAHSKLLELILFNFLIIVSLPFWLTDWEPMIRGNIWEDIRKVTLVASAILWLIFSMSFDDKTPEQYKIISTVIGILLLGLLLFTERKK